MVPAALIALAFGSLLGQAQAAELAQPQPLTLSAADGTRLSLGLFEGKGRRLILVAPGFGQRMGTDTMRFVAGLLTPTAQVAILDFRGTGSSHGEYNFGSRERQDIQAALAWAQGRYPRVDLLGFSMGAYIAACAAAEGPLRPGKLLLVSPPTRLEDVVWSFGFLTHPIDLVWNHHKKVEHGSVDPFFTWGSLFAPKPKAQEAVASLEVPVHFLAGGRDLLIFKRYSRLIYDAVPGKKTWTEWPEGGHAEHMALEDPKAFAAWVQQSLKDEGR